MNQKIRSNTFETNSSSTHSIVLLNREIEPIKPVFNIQLINESSGNIICTAPQEILSYLYTLAVIHHNWALYDKLHSTYTNCIFQKPVYDLSAYTDDGEEHYGICDDRTISSFCEVVNASLPSPYFSDDALNTICTNLEDIVTNGAVYVLYDETPFIKYLTKDDGTILVSGG